MNTNYLNEYASLFERLLSISHFLDYSTNAVERSISNCKFFRDIEKDGVGFPPIVVDVKLVREVFLDQSINLRAVPTYKQSMWAAESYLRIQNETGLTFEAIFLYLPIDKMYEYFPLYHEMDFSQIINEFKKLYETQSILKIVTEKYGYSLSDISDKTGISYETLFSFKKRRRDIKKANADIVVKLASVLRIRIETLIEFSFKNC